MDSRKREAKVAEKRKRKEALESRTEVNTDKGTEEEAAKKPQKERKTSEVSDEKDTAVQAVSEEIEEGTASNALESDDLEEENAEMDAEMAMYDVEEDDLDADLDEDSSSGSDEEDVALSAASEEEDESVSVQRQAKLAETKTGNGAAAAKDRSSSSGKLDPSLFFASFSKDRKDASTSILKGKHVHLGDKDEDEEAMFQRQEAERERRRKLKRKGGVVKGRDGQPMRRLKDGRTVIRALAAPASKDVEDTAEAHFEERLAPHRPLDTFEAQPGKAVTSFKERRLGFNQKPSHTQAKGVQGRKGQSTSGDDDDRLLDALMHGGGLNDDHLTGKRKRSDKSSKPKRQGAPGKNRRPAPTFGFARS